MIYTVFSATIVPAPIAIPALAYARVGASLTPSLVMAFVKPLDCNSLTLSDFSLGVPPQKNHPNPVHQLPCGLPAGYLRFTSLPLIPIF
jgi:hypothetical protein